MGLAGAKMARWADRLAAYAEGEVPLVLAPAGGGAGVSFVHDQDATEFEGHDGGGMDRVFMVVLTRAPLVTGAQYTFDGHAWTVTKVRADWMAGASWPARAVLERHAH